MLAAPLDKCHVANGAHLRGPAPSAWPTPVITWNQGQGQQGCPCPCPCPCACPCPATTTRLVFQAKVAKLQLSATMCGCSGMCGSTSLQGVHTYRDHQWAFIPKMLLVTGDVILNDVNARIQRVWQTVLASRLRAFFTTTQVCSPGLFVRVLPCSGAGEGGPAALPCVISRDGVRVAGHAPRKCKGSGTGGNWESTGSVTECNGSVMGV